MILQYIVEYYESLFPDLEKFKDEGIQEELNTIRKTGFHLEEDDGDNTSKWLSQEEYSRLSSIERYQLALDRYKARHKSNWAIGRDYERYIGYLYEKEGYKVTFHGIAKGLEDLGIDLICSKKGKTELIQCKYWAERKTIHEKHINQLYGTTVKYYIDKNHNEGLYTFNDALKSGDIVPRFITSTTLSEKAKVFANTLGVVVDENIKLEEYPLIKCNINHETGEKIYHLPFDQQYDKAMIINEGEYYVDTVKEAEDLGFRRALRWIQD
ncbi:Restriction endonuclease [Natronincola peptidivorans]|uniref:Restriction endonuclease n=1 Tax=Natronincola peptidivorans TaxID=426128 RepID=A0A1I0EL90_9FIRM|nr:restriction endonuclease [Natronincola peptidivorans]SET46141.1 Restriction endonuclease [Natronincola peptidivorans]